MAGILDILGLASPGGTSTKSSARPGAIVRLGLAGAGIAIAIGTAAQ